MTDTFSSEMIMLKGIELNFIWINLQLDKPFRHYYDLHFLSNVLKLKSNGYYMVSVWFNQDFWDGITDILQFKKLILKNVMPFEAQFIEISRIITGYFDDCSDWLKHQIMSIYIICKNYHVPLDLTYYNIQKVVGCVLKLKYQ